MSEASEQLAYSIARCDDIFVMRCPEKMLRERVREWRDNARAALLPLNETGECDCCGKKAALTRVWVHHIETYACDECRS